MTRWPSPYRRHPGDPDSLLSRSRRHSDAARLLGGAHGTRARLNLKRFKVYGAELDMLATDLQITLGDNDFDENSPSVRGTPAVRQGQE
jgi:hypothetical protein